MRITWRLAAACAMLGTSAMTSAQQVVPPANKPKLICKRSTETGSLVAKRKECRTRDEWEREVQAGREAGERLIDDNRPRFGIDR